MVDRRATRVGGPVARAGSAWPLGSRPAGVCHAGRQQPPSRSHSPVAIAVGAGGAAPRRGGSRGAHARGQERPPQPARGLRVVVDRLAAQRRLCGEPACRRDSVRPCGRGGHPSVRPTWGVGRAALPTLGLAPGGVCRAVRVAPGAGALLPHRFTLACALRSPGPPSAVCSLLHFPAGHPDWPLASTLPCGAPTFLDPVAAGPRPPGRLTTSIVPRVCAIPGDMARRSRKHS